MEYEYSTFWFIAAIIVGVIFISLAILLGLQIVYSMTPIPDTYKECIASDLPPHICEILYPPINRQNV